MPKINRHNLYCLVLLSIILFVIWTLLSGVFEVKFLLIGLFSSIIISAICMPFMLYKSSVDDSEHFLLKINLFKLIPYLFWLAIEIIKSSISVAKQIYTPGLKIKPRVVAFKMQYVNPLAKVLLSNSIILTPGTLTIDVSEEGVYVVHAIDEGAANDLYAGGMAYKVASLFNETCAFEALYQYERTDINEYIGEDF